jgi:hypothetical protein
MGTIELANSRSRRTLAAVLPFLIGLGLLGVAAGPASAFSISNGDLIVTFVKNGFELILNEGAAPTGPPGTQISATTLTLPPQFGGTLEGAKWTALAVRHPDLQFTAPELAGAPQANIILTTSADPSVVTFQQIADAQAQLQPPNQGMAWFSLLRSIGAVDGTNILENTPSRLVIGTSLFASYTGVLGFNTDAIANTLTISTAGTIGANVIGTSLPLYELLQTISVPDFNLGTQIVSLGSVRLVPEPGTALLVVAGVAWLAGSRRRATRNG